MDLLILLFLFLVSVFLTILITIGLRNRGPWENPMMFFLVLFLTSWTISLWMGPIVSNNSFYTYISIAFLEILISLLLAATQTRDLGGEKMRIVRNRKVVDVVTNPVDRPRRKTPNGYFWGLIILETLLILIAYYTKAEFLIVK